MLEALTKQENLYIVQLMSGLENECQLTPVTVFIDNQRANALFKDPVSNQTSNHVDICNM